MWKEHKTIKHETFNKYKQYTQIKKDTLRIIEQKTIQSVPFSVLASSASSSNNFSSFPDGIVLTITHNRKQLWLRPMGKTMSYWSLPLGNRGNQGQGSQKKNYSKVIDRSTASLLMFFVIPCPTSHVSCINDFTEWNLEKLMALLSEKNGKTSKRIYINLKNSTCTFMHIYNTSSIKYTWVVYILSYFIKQQFSQTCLSSFSTDGGWNCLSHLF